MKILLIIPPITIPNQYHSAVPLLSGQLEFSGFDSTSCDANIGFYNHILMPENIKKHSVLAKNEYIKLKKKFKNIKYKIGEENLHDSLTEYQRYKNLAEIYENAQYSDLFDNCCKYINSAVKTLKSGESFYKAKLLNRSFNLLNTATQIVSNSYDNWKFSFYGSVKYDKNLLNLKYLDEHIDDKFVFTDYFNELVTDIKNQNPDLIGISLTYEEQTVPGLILSNMLKRSVESKILLGGNHLSRIFKELPSKLLLFDKYTDFVIAGNGEKSLIELCNYLQGSISVKEVSNLTYRVNDEITENSYKTVVRAGEVHSLSLKGLDMNSYFSPEVVAPLQLSKGCYWGKCSFCTHSLEKNYTLRDMSLVRDEIAMYQKNGISTFTIIDEAVSPKLLETFADMIIQNDINITYMADARFEDGFDDKLFKKAYQSGLRLMLWGFETANKRVHSLLNKDVCFENRANILNAAADNNIFSHLFVFHGFPTATFEEEKETLDFICRNRNIIGSFVTDAFFVLSLHSYISEHPELYGITQIYRNERPDFCDSYDYTGNGISALEKNEITKLSTELRKQYFNYYIPLYIREYLLLYLSRFGGFGSKNSFIFPEKGR